MMSSATFPKRHTHEVEESPGSSSQNHKHHHRLAHKEKEGGGESRKMGLGSKNKRRPSQLSLLQAEAEAAHVSPLASPDTSPQSSPRSFAETPLQRPQSAPEEQQLPSPALTPPQEPERTENPPDDPVAQEARPDDLLDPALIGRTIKLVRQDDWTQDIIQTPPQQTKILYENQRGMFFFGKPYFSSNSLIQTFKFDPPPYQTTDTFLSSPHPSPLDPCNPHSLPPHHHKDKRKETWPPDQLKLYFSPYTPRDAFLALDSETGNAWRWRQDRWYVDMRGDVDEEGWEYAFYWNGRYTWVGGNWHGKAVLGHGWVRRRKWVREIVRKEKRDHGKKDGMGEREEEQVGKRSGGGFDGLLSILRDSPSPSLRRKALMDFFDAVLPETLKQLESYIHHIYILLDPISTTTLISLLQTQLTTSQDSDVTSSLTTSLTFLTSKHDALATTQHVLSDLLSVPDERWTPPSNNDQLTTRRHRLRQLRAEWRRTKLAPGKLIRKVRFAHEEGGTERWFAASEGVGGAPVGRTRRSESEGGRSEGEEWFEAMEEPGGKVERGGVLGGC